jgi:predicted O-methyltransferase YrrM
LYLFLRAQRRRFTRAGRDDRDVRELALPTPDGRQLMLRDHDLSEVRLESGPVVASQKYEELVPLLDRVRALRAERVCEIGTAAGGTLYLLTRVSAPEALLVSIDLAIPAHTRATRARFARAGQRLVSIEGDSHDVETQQRVERLLAGAKLDVLFIDGDHSYEGVRADFELYSPLVRSGGIIALHDVNEDFATRHGTPTASVSGDVPRFWNELKRKYRSEELIADPGQDGFGIGIVYP